MSELHVVRPRGKRKILKPISQDQIRQNLIEGKDGEMLHSQHLLISMMLPPSVKAFFQEMESEVEALCGQRYSREAGVSRYGAQAGSIILGNQRVSVQKPRVRGPEGEVPLVTYARFQDPSLFDSQVFEQGLKHVSQRDYEKGLPQVAASFGINKSTVSRSWVKSTKKQVEKLLNRDLRSLDIIAVFIDGKRFSKLGVVVAMGVGSDGRKHVLGIYQSSTENSAACIELLGDLERRGLAERDLLFIVDGGGGLNKALNEKYQVENPTDRRALRVRCFIHKWRNIEDVLDEKGKQEAAPLYWAIREARDLSSAQVCSEALEACLKRYNVSALNSYLEAKQDLLAIHRLKMGAQLKKFFSSTNPIESLNSLLEEDLRRVKRWRDSEHFQRWLATACLSNEKRMRKIRGFRSLPALKIRLQELCNSKETVDNETNVA
jgi:transposase-like protein